MSAYRKPLSPRTVEIVKRVRAGEIPRRVAVSLGIKPQSVAGTLLRVAGRALIVCDWCGCGAIREGGNAGNAPAGWRQTALRVGHEYLTACPECAATQLETAGRPAKIG